DVGDVVVAASRAQRLAQVGLLPGEQAGAHAPFGGQAGAAAVRAEGAGDRGDHAHPATVTAGGAVVDLEQLGRCTVAGLVDLGQHVALGQDLVDIGGGEHGGAV